MEREIVLTEDGSHTIKLGGRVECYHSTYGAIQESEHIFINCALKPAINGKTDFRIFEVGFGTGLNAFLTCMHLIDEDINVIYDSIEAYPVEEELWGKLNYADNTNIANGKLLFDSMHQAEWGKAVVITPNFILNKHVEKLELFNFKEKYDVVYFDAFDPSFQPELWTEEVFQKIFNAMNTNGVLTTYCAKGTVKRALKSVGFVIEGLSGPKGKREITRAWRV